MALARVVTFEGVDDERMAGMTAQMREQGRPAELPATELLVLHDRDAQRAVVVLFFENADDYSAGDAVLNAMPTDETPGQRASVGRYEVAFRMTG